MTAQSRPTQRDWKVMRSSDDPPMPQIAWSMKITDIGGKFHDPQSYRQLIERWSWTVLREMQALIDQLNQPGS